MILRQRWEGVLLQSSLCLWNNCLSPSFNIIIIIIIVIIITIIIIIISCVVYTTGYSTSSLPSLLSEIYTHVCLSGKASMVHPSIAKKLMISQEKTRNATTTSTTTVKATKMSSSSSSGGGSSSSSSRLDENEDEYLNGGSISAGSTPSSRRIIRIGIVSGSFDSIPGCTHMPIIW